MSLILCHECYFWVEPQHACCPECHEQFDEQSVDPSPEELELLIGDIVMDLGEVHLKRKTLPELGELYATTEGLFFLPHDVHRVTEIVNTSGSSTLMWTLASFLWSPLVLFSFLLRGSKRRPTRVRKFVPRALGDEHSAELSRCLMENPGAFFVKRLSIRQLQARGKRWRLDRVTGNVLKFRPTAGVQAFREQLEALQDLRNWHSLILL